MVGIDEFVAVVAPITTFGLGIFLGWYYQRKKTKVYVNFLQERMVNAVEDYYETMRSPEAMVEAQLAARRIREARDNGRKTMPRESAGPPAIINRNAFNRAKRRRYGPPPGLK